jgi:segregation and condensation protein B
MGDKYSMQIKAEYTQNVKKFASGGLIPEAVLKTLTIIAVKQPMLKSMLIKIRGSTAYDHVKFLVDRGFITNDRKGRSEELITTEQFADTFGLSRDMETLKKQMIAQLGVSEEAIKERPVKEKASKEKAEKKDSDNEDVPADKGPKPSDKEDED